MAEGRRPSAMTCDAHPTSSDDRGTAPDAPQPIRTFIAVLISEDIKRRIGLVEEEFKKLAPEVKWVAEENLHVTLKFLGNVPAERLERIAAALGEALSCVEPFEIEVADVGAFPSAGIPRTVWVGVTSGQEELADVARRVEKALEKLGFPREDRPFTCHITIGRVKDGRGARELAPALQEAEVGRLGSVLVGSVAVMRSDLRREGPIYSTLSEIHLLGGKGGGGR